MGDLYARPEIAKQAVTVLNREMAASNGDAPEWKIASAYLSYGLMTERPHSFVVVERRSSPLLGRPRYTAKVFDASMREIAEAEERGTGGPIEELYTAAEGQIARTNWVNAEAQLRSARADYELS